MRYIADSNGYLKEVIFGGQVSCGGRDCVSYTGPVPDGYDSLAEWYQAEECYLYMWRVVDDVLVKDSTASGTAGDASDGAIQSMECGTWTPVLSGDVTYTSRSGHYVKIGKMVWIHCDIQISSKGGTSSALLITGLPFAPAYRCALSESYDYATKTPQVALAEPAGYIRLTHDSAGSWGTTTHAYINDTFHVVIGGIFQKN